MLFVELQEDRDKILLVLKLCSRIEELEKILLPSVYHDKDHRAKWGKIVLDDKDRTYFLRDDVQNFRKGIADLKMDKHRFVDNVVQLYSDLSNIAAHKIFFPIPFDHASVEEMYSNLGITPDENKIRATIAILKPIPGT